MINSVLSIHFIEFLENIIESLNYKKKEGWSQGLTKTVTTESSFSPPPTYPYCPNRHIECIFPLRNSRVKEKNFHK